MRPTKTINQDALNALTRKKKTTTPKTNTTTPQKTTKTTNKKPTSKLSKATINDPIIAGVVGQNETPTPQPQTQTQQPTTTPSNPFTTTVKTKIQFRLSQPEKNRLDAIFEATIGKEPYRSPTKMSEIAVSEYITDLQNKHNNGQPFNPINKNNFPLNRERTKSKDGQPLVSLGINVTEETANQIRGAVLATSNIYGKRSISTFIHDAVLQKIENLEQTYAR